MQKILLNFRKSANFSAAPFSSVFDTQIFTKETKDLFIVEKLRQKAWSTMHAYAVLQSLDWN
jgi:hypothetical protein